MKLYLPWGPTDTTSPLRRMHFRQFLKLFHNNDLFVSNLHNFLEMTYVNSKVFRKDNLFDEDIVVI
jgi:hypothetical protein